MIVEYLNSVVTLIVGVVAIYVYKKQKLDTKRDAANSILLEIQHAERSIDKVRDFIKKDSLDVDVIILQADSWIKNKHLFSRDFDKDEWDSITDFYERAKLLDQAVAYNHLGFSSDVEQIRSNKQRMLADFTKELVGELELSNKEDWTNIIAAYKTKVDIFDQQYMEQQGRFAYNPSKPISDAKLYVNEVKKLTTSSVGQKLKNISKAK